MSMKLIHASFRVAVFGALCVTKVMVAGAVEAKAEIDRSLSKPSEQDGVERKSKTPESRVRSESDLAAEVKSLQESLALANAEAEFFSQQYKELRLQHELMGIDALTADEQKLQDRVIQAVKELYQVEQERRELVNRLEQLLAASQALLKTADRVSPDLRAEYEVAVRAAREFLAGRGSGPIPLARDLQDGQIVHVNPELNTVIVNVGSRLGLKPGMPLRVLRGEILVGQLKVFQVRETVSAALVEQTAKGMELTKGDKIEIVSRK
jgi:hypothetical protein